ncbi:MAG TPA: hypothetical protein VI583_05310 [Cyclobacteriaceae bacterium]|nr:hypothetical protein [Cyclobacteriaceae bacterium]
MKSLIQVCLVLLPAIPVTGQDNRNSEAYWKNYTSVLSYELKLAPVSSTKHNFHFRIWHPGQVVDIWQDSLSKFHGEITCFAREYDESNLGKRNFYGERTTIDQVWSAEIHDLFISSGAQSIPTSDLIPGWDNELGDIAYVFEQFVENQYGIKTYISPGLQSSVQEAATIQAYISQIGKTLRLKKVFRVFSKSIPFYCYTIGTRAVSCKKIK